MAQQAAEHGNTNAISDAGTAAALAMACLQGAGLNVRINVASLGKHKEGAKLLKQQRDLESRAYTLQAAVSEQVAARGGFALD